jgi:hypothetical protein
VISRFRVQRFRVQDSRVLATGCWSHQVSGVRLQVSGVRKQKTDDGYSVLSFEFD